MQISFNPRYYRHVPVIYWPWVCWQLLCLRVWATASGRDVLFEISETGHVRICQLSDDPRDLRAWMARQRHIEPAHHCAMNDPSGEAHLCAIHYWMGRLMACGVRLVWVWVRVVARPVPAVIDTS